jgi:uncharacterized membrane protein
MLRLPLLPLHPLPNLTSHRRRKKANPKLSNLKTVLGNGVINASVVAGIGLMSLKSTNPAKVEARIVAHLLPIIIIILLLLLHRRHHHLHKKLLPLMKQMLLQHLSIIWILYNAETNGYACF